MDFEGNILGWIRQSSDSQHSIASQMQAFETFCKSHSFERVQTLAFVGSAMSNDPTTFFDVMRAQGVMAYDEYKKALDAGIIDMVWAIDPTRYGRAKWLYNYMVQYAIDHGATVYAEGTGVIDEANFDAMVALTSIGSQSDVKRLHGLRAKQTYRNKAKQGIPPRAVSWVHQKVLDRNGKVSGIKINEDAKPAIAMATDMLLKGYSYREIGERLPQNFVTHREVTRVFYHPMAHGHMFIGDWARNLGLWCIEEGNPVPDNIEVFYNASPHACIWSPTDHPRVIEELKTRLKAHPPRGRNSESKNPFMKLVICANCKNPMVYDFKMKSNKTYEYLRCGARCSNTKLTRLDYMIEWFDARIRVALKEGYLTLDDTGADRMDSWRESVKHLEQHIDSLERTLSQLILDMAQTTELRSLYETQISKKTTELKNAQNQLVTLKLERPHDPQASIDSLDLIREMTVDEFWTIKPSEINLVLRAVMWNFRVAVCGKTAEVVLLGD